MTTPHPIVPGLTGLTLLARGGYATVYRAVQDSVGREVAVKIENRTLESERDRRRFLREARASGSMSSHPHVVDLFDAGVCVGGHPYLIMELCQGSYADRLRIAPLNACQTRDVGAKIADALADAHSLGVLHRDVKPANILISRFGEPALADFGLAILAETRDMSITLDVLTPAYAPPEMFRHEAPAPSGDVYALCATLYAMLRGRPPRWRDGEANPSVMSMVDMFDEPVPEITGVPADLMALLRCGLANDPSARPTAAELRDTLAALRLDPSRSDQHGGGAGWDAVTADGEATATEPHLAALSGAALSDAALVDLPTQPAGGTDHPGRVAVPGTARRWRWYDTARRWKWRHFGLIAGITLADVLAVAVAVAVFSTGDSRVLGDSMRGSSPSPHVTRTHVQDLRSSLPQVVAQPGGEAGGCPMGVPPELRCPSSPECYDTVVIDGGYARSAKLDCAVRHTWEVFALGQLPPDITTASRDVVMASGRVRATCDIGTLVLVAGIGTLGWKTEILPPTAEAFRAGDRTYRCLAGKGQNALLGPQLRSAGAMD